MPKVRVSWIITLSAIVCLAVVPVLRQQVVNPAAARAVHRVIAGGPSNEDPFAEFRRQALPFVERHYPKDPEMLLAAGLLTRDAKLGSAAIERAARLGRQPVYYAAYADLLEGRAPLSSRFGEDLLHDPTSPFDGDIALGWRPPASADSQSAAAGGFTRETTAPILETLREWEAADPDNGYPHAVESYYLYGLGRDQEAARAWDAAGRLPRARIYDWEGALARVRLLQRMGMPEADARALGNAGMLGRNSRRFEQIVNQAWYAGRLAQLGGKDVEAMRWWMSMIAFGRHLQDGSDTYRQFRLGVNVEAEGVAAAWRPLLMSPDLKGPIGAYAGMTSGGRFYRGPAYAVYTTFLGQAATDEMRDTLLKGWVRAALIADAPGPLELTGLLRNAVGLQGVAGAAVVLAGCCLSLFLLVSLWSRRTADAAARRGWVWPTLTAVLVLAPALWGSYSSLVLHPPIIDFAGTRHVPPPPDLAPVEGLGAAVALAVLVPLLLAMRVTVTEVEMGATAWRGNLRRMLPVTVALCALACLGLQVTSARQRADWLRVWAKPGVPPLRVQTERLGAKWDHPTIPEGAWVAADAPPAPEFNRGPRGTR